MDLNDWFSYDRCDHAKSCSTSKKDPTVVVDDNTMAVIGSREFSDGNGYMEDRPNNRDACIENCAPKKISIKHFKFMCRAC